MKIHGRIVVFDLVTNLPQMLACFMVCIYDLAYWAHSMGP